jgi:predicted Zn-dependent peptidase
VLPCPERLLSASFVLLALLARPLTAQSSGQISFERFPLPNGLDVVLAPDPTTDAVAVDVWYFAGSRDETATSAGVARLFDRLMFAGSTNVPPGGHATLIEVGGGRVTAAIDEDVSRFGETVPAAMLPQALWLEAERMRGIAINDTTVNESRGAMLADIRARLAREPYTGVILQSVAAIYDSLACPAYTRSPVSRELTTANVTAATTRGFFDLFYRPNNARLVVTGNFDPAIARRLVEEYFSGVPRGRDIVRVGCSPEAAKIPPRRTITDNSVARAAAGIFYRVPAPTHEDAAALELLGVVLGQGTGSRLRTVLIAESAAAASIQAGPFGERTGPGAFGLFAVAAQGVSGDSLVRLLGAQAAWAAGDGLTEAALLRARNIFRATWASRRERPQDLAEELQKAASYGGDIETVNTMLDRVLAISLADLRRVAARWLTLQNALTVVVSPGGAS